MEKDEAIPPRAKAVLLVDTLMPFALPIAKGEIPKLPALNNAKKIAVIMVDEIMNLDTILAPINETQKHLRYWYEVKTEIEKL